ncbi:hypothetical protein B0A55_09373 [Friedmanniomyces simplex]|uniref:Apple domain-containing protein n=1 Tax=Friedmanniomyces simplex TaxID=329884 RepID=A0A4U0WZX0_9PEZI|nr:hypothetical protein B0A55_09373 [Friedmanniomyces simplex]
MATLYQVLALAALVSNAAAVLSAASLPPISSYSYTFTVTTPTTLWHAPAFATSSPASPPCADSMCPALNGKSCVDADGDVYGVLCDTRFSGTVITNSGKKEKAKKGRMIRGQSMDAESELDKRDFTGTFDGCADFCNSYDDLSAPCTGVAYQGGYCMVFDTITGTFAQAGGIAAVRQT